MELKNEVLSSRFILRYTLLLLSVFLIFIVCLDVELGFQWNAKNKAKKLKSFRKANTKESKFSFKENENFLENDFEKIVTRNLSQSDHDSKTLSESLLESVKLTFPIGRSIHDNKGLLSVYYFLWVGKGWKSSLNGYDICLATQTSLDRLYWLPEILDHWNAAVSIAVHITNEQEWFILNLFISFLQRCYHSFERQVALHVAVPASVGALFISEYTLQEWTWNMTLDYTNIVNHTSCKEAKQYMEFLLETFPVTDKEKLMLKEAYPQNHMRNIARRACNTKWIYIIDIDIIPCAGMAEALQEFYVSKSNEPNPCEKCAYVIPTFELDERVSYPKSKKEVVKFYKTGVARQFHLKIVSRGHKATNYQQWRTTYLDHPKIIESHPITLNETYKYEPFYVSPDTIPPYDERFVGYGFTRSSQFKEALTAGWNFTVLTPIFSIHWGLQTRKKLLSTKEAVTGQNVRKNQTTSNADLFRRILKEMKLKQRYRLF